MPINSLLYRENIVANQAAREQFVSTCSSVNAEYESKSGDLRSAVNGNFSSAYMCHLNFLKLKSEAACFYESCPH